MSNVICDLNLPKDGINVETLMKEPGTAYGNKVH
jgi:hypothetical protein